MQSEYNEHSQGLRNLGSYLLFGEYPSRACTWRLFDRSASRSQIRGVIMALWYHGGITGRTHMVLELAHI